MTLTIEIPDNLEAALKTCAMAKGVSETGYLLELLELNLADSSTAPPFETGFGSLAKYGPSPTAEEIDHNRAEMFRGFGENF